MKKEWNDVREFHEKFGHPCPDAPRMLDKKRSLSRAKWMNEEVAEFLVAEDIYEQADAMIDLMYFALGTMVESRTNCSKSFSRLTWPSCGPTASRTTIPRTARSSSPIRGRTMHRKSGPASMP